MDVGYGILFVVCGSVYLSALILMHLLVPKFRQFLIPFSCGPAIRPRS